MKKFLFALGAAAISLATVSCDKSSATGDSDKAFGDSISAISGEFTGSSWAKSYEEIPAEQRAGFRKDAILRGIDQVVMCDTADHGFIAGLNIGLQLNQQLLRLEESGIKVDRKKFLSEFSKAFKQDSINEVTLIQLREEFNALNSRANQMAMAEMQRRADAEKAARAEAPEAKENKSLGEKYISSEKAADPEIKTTPSGLSYKVVRPGTGIAVGGNGRATVKYSGKLVDGTVFDSNDNAVFSPDRVIPGFGEGLQMMQKGGHYILYIPGELAYGVDGIPGTIPPMATLVFDVEVIDVQPAE